MKLRELSADVERGTLTGDLIKALCRAISPLYE